MSYQSLVVYSWQFRTVFACIFLLFTSINSKLASHDCFTAFPTPPVNSSNFTSTLIKFGRASNQALFVWVVGMESTPKPAKNAGPGVPIWPPVASKCLLLYIRNDQSSYIEISDPIGDVGYLSVWVIQQLFSKNLHFCACAGNNVTTVVTKNK